MYSRGNTEDDERLPRVRSGDGEKCARISGDCETDIPFFVFNFA